MLAIPLQKFISYGESYGSLGWQWPPILHLCCLHFSNKFRRENKAVVSSLSQMNVSVLKQMAPVLKVMPTVLLVQIELSKFNLVLIKNM